jgi:hypothetical protein
MMSKQRLSYIELYTDDIIFEAAALNGLNRLFSGKQYGGPRVSGATSHPIN